MKGQVQSLEPVVVILIVGVLAAIAIIFFTRVGDTQLDADLESLDRQRGAELLRLVSDLPELSCPASVTTDTYCIDLYKALAFETLMQEETFLYYQPLFGTTEAILTYIDLDDGEEHDILLYDGLGNASNVRASVTYFTVHDPVRKERKFAYMTLRRDAE